MKISKVMTLYLLMNFLYLKSIPFFPKVISRVIRILFTCELPPSCEIEKSAKLMHGGLGIIVHKHARIGENTLIYQNVTIAGSNGKAPTIGKNVLVGAGAIIIGDVEIGDNVKIGANAVVTSNIYSGSTAVGVPATVL